MGGVGGAGFALPRDRGAALAVRVRLAWLAFLVRVSRLRAMPVGDRRSTGRRWWGGFRAAARCRSETGAPGGVVGAGFALPREAGRRPALQAALVGRVSRCRAMPVGDRRSRRRRWGGFRAPARCRSETGAPGAASVGRVSRCRAMPVGDRRSWGRRRWGGFRAAARCRSETGAPGAASVGRVSRSRAMPVGDRRSRRRWGGFRAYARCRSETGAPGAASVGRVSRSRAMVVGDRRSLG